MRSSTHHSHGFHRHGSHQGRRRRSRSPGQRGVSALVGGAVVLFLGIWFTLDQLGVAVPGLDRLWPVFVILGGASSLLGWALAGFRRPEALFSGIVTTLVGWFLFFFTLGPLRWEDMATMWPVFPLIVSFAFCVRFVAGLGKEPRLLVPAVTTGLVGVCGLLIYHTPVGSLLGVVGWPLVLILVGVLMFFKGMLLTAFQSMRLFANRT